MDSELVVFLRQHAVQETAHGTHTTLISPRMRFSFEGAEIQDQFMKLYCAILKHRPHAVLGVTELPGLQIPVIVDVDLERPHADTAEHRPLYSRTHLRETIRVFRSVLEEVAVQPLPESALWCAVFQKKPYTKTRADGSAILKHGFHLHFPNFVVTRSVYANIIYPKVIARAQSLDIFADTFGYPDDPIDYRKIIDKACVTNPWLMYGSRKSPDLDAYTLSGILDTEFRPVLLSQVVAASDYCWPSGQPLDDLDTATVDDMLPLIFSIHAHHRAGTPILPQLLSRALGHDAASAPRADRTGITFTTDRTPAEVKADIATATQLMPMIHKRRASNYSEWIHMCWLLYNISAGHHDGLQLFLDFSASQPDKFDAHECERRWYASTDRGMSIKTLVYYARTDSPDKFREWSNTHAISVCESIVMYTSHLDIALMLKHLHAGKYICASIKQRIWYEFRDHRWRLVEEGHSLRERIHIDVEHIIQGYEARLLKVKEDFSNKKRNEEEEETGDGDGEDGADTKDKTMDPATIRKNCNDMLKGIRRIRGAIKSAPFKMNVMQECAHVFYEEGFMDNLDADPHLIVFSNGVYDLRNCMFRDGCPEDYLSLQMPVAYKEFSTTDPAVINVHKFLEQVFPDKSIRDYFLNLYCDVFVGGNAAKIVAIWSADGDNGKSVTEALFEKMLGRYAIKLPTSLLTGKRTQSSSACPELARAGNGVRWAVLQEPDQSDQLNSGILKELTGNDSFFARGLYKEGAEIKPQFKLVLVANDPPKIPYSDKATWNRIRVIPFESTFTDDAPDNYADQLDQKRFKKDKRFADKLAGMTQAFAWVLLNHRKNVRGVENTSFPEPDKVLAATNTYKARNDVYRQFIAEQVVHKDGAELSLNAVYGSFKAWFKDSVSGIPLPGKSDVRMCLSKMWGDPLERGTKTSGACWVGYELFTGDMMVTDVDVDVDDNDNDNDNIDI